MDVLKMVRRHHTRNAPTRTKNGGTRQQIMRIARKLGIRYGGIVK